MSFSELSIPPPLLEALAARGFVEPTAVQRAVLVPANGGRDLLVSSRTGSGKTVAFGLALVEQLLSDGALPDPSAGPAVLVVAPTRELATQVRTELAWLFAPLGARVATCVGGTDVRAEARVLHGGVHVVVGTPGRLCDHLARKSLVLGAVRVLVLDEADEMLDMGFREELEQLLAAAPPARRTLLFSATLPPPIVELAGRYQRDARRITAGDAGGAHADIEYRAHLIAPRDREHAVVNVLRSADAARALVFCATREAVTHLQAGLLERGFSAVAMSGELTQPERTRALQALRDGRARVLVATDVAARGIDLPDVTLVIHADLPHDAQVFQHRSGRTGRAGRKGVAVLLSPRHRRGLAELLLKKAKAKPTWTPLPSADEIRARDQERLFAELAASVGEVEPQDAEVARRLLEQAPAEALVAALVRSRRAVLPAPEELEPVAPPSAGRAAEGRAASRVRSGVEPVQRASAEVDTVAAEVAARDAGPAAAMARMDEEDEGAGSGAERPALRARPSRPPADRAGAPRLPPTRDGAVWFRLGVGRQQNADPRWLLPLICRRGSVTKAELGRIRIEDRQSFVEVAARAADAFERSALQPDPKDRNVRFERVGADGAARASREGGGASLRPPRPAFSGAPDGRRERTEASFERPRPPRKAFAAGRSSSVARTSGERDDRRAGPPRKPGRPGRTDAAPRHAPYRPPRSKPRR